MSRLALAAATLLMLAGSSCSASEPSPTQEDAVVEACIAALAERLGEPEDKSPTQTLMVGKRSSGWLVRGLSKSVGQQPARNYECGLSTDAPGPPRLDYLRTCPAGESPWGCPSP